MNLTDFETDLSESVQNLKRVLPLMSKERVPTTPGNYALWYDFVTRRNDALCLEMEQHLRTGNGISPTVSKALFDKHFGGAKNGKRQKSCVSHCTSWSAMWSAIWVASV